MDLYISSLLLGATGLGAMALSGLGNRGHSGAQSHGHGAGSTGGHGHAAHAPGGHAHVGHAHGAHGTHGHTVAHLSASLASRTFWSITSPRFLFSFALGFGVAGQIFRSALGGPFLLAAAIGGGILFERLLVAPLWNFAMRFASQPAQTLESAITDEATAVTSFDANGQGIVSIEVDGQVQQILATLSANDRLLPGARVRAGQRLRIEDVDAERNRCTVTIL